MDMMTTMLNKKIINLLMAADLAIHVSADKGWTKAAKKS